MVWRWLAQNASPVRDRIKCFEGNNMGKGDKRTTRGKIFKGSYGNTRLQRAKKKAASAGKPAAKKTAKKA